MISSVRQQAFSWWIPVILLTILAYFIQSHIYLFRDVTAITHAAGAMLSGETYGKNIFEPSPPMILYLSMPAIFLAKWTSLSVISAIRIYFLILALVSINISRYILKKLFDKNTLLINFLTYTLVCVLFFLPTYHFAQREHFLLVLITPYLFLTALRLENKNINCFFAVMIGLMAGIGFSIKPHFLSAFLLIELFYLYKKQSLFAWAKIETLCIVGVIFTYILAVVFFYPEYIHEVLPLWLNFYTSIYHPIIDIVSYPHFIYCLGIIILYFITRHLNNYKNLSDLLLITLVGFLCSYLFPRVAWYYHIFPALGISCLLMIIIVEQIIKRISITKSTVFLFIPIVIIINFIPLFFTIQTMAEHISYFKSNNDFSKLIQFFKKKGINTTYTYLAMTHEYTLLEFYTPAHYVGRLPILMWEYHEAYIHYNPKKKINPDEKTTFSSINIISQELNEEKPRFVIVDTPSSLMFLGKKIDYIEKYRHYENFRTAWQSYRFLKKIGPAEIYERIYN